MFKRTQTLPLLVVVLEIVGFITANALGINSALLMAFLIFITLSQGMNIVYGYTGYLPFGYAGFFGAGAYGFAISVMHGGLTAPFALIIGAVAALILGFVLTPLFRLAGAYFAIGSLAVALILKGVIENPALSNLTQGPYGISIPQVYDPTAVYYTGIGIAAFSTALAFYLEHSRLGRRLRAATDDSDSAQMIGIRVSRVRAIAWLIAALIGGLGGALFAWNTYTFFPDTVFDVSYTMFPLLFVLVGGARSAVGTLLATLIMYGLYNTLGAQTQYAQIFFSIAIILIVIFLPRGLGTSIRNLYEKRNRGFNE